MAHDIEQAGFYDEGFGADVSIEDVREYLFPPRVAKVALTHEVMLQDLNKVYEHVGQGTD